MAHPRKDDDEKDETPTPKRAAAKDAAEMPTLPDAFYTLCQAISGHLADEDMVAWSHSQEIQSWYMNAGEDAAGVAQRNLAWQHAVQLLEGVLGVPLSGH